MGAESSSGTQNDKADEAERAMLAAPLTSTSAQEEPVPGTGTVYRVFWPAQDWSVAFDLRCRWLV